VKNKNNTNNEVEYDKNFESKNKKNCKYNRPIIFTKKTSNKCITIPLNVLKSDIGQTRHFPPAAQE